MLSIAELCYLILSVLLSYDCAFSIQVVDFGVRRLHSKSVLLVLGYGKFLQ